MITIGLSSNAIALVDDCDSERVLEYKWSLLETGVNRYAVRSGQGKKTVYLHRFVVGAEHGVMVDHKDGNGLNCVRSNLRIATRAENNRNRQKSSSPLCTSRFIGVGLHEGKWRARLRTEGKYFSLGRFDSEIDAAMAYDRAAIDQHGRFARLNFPNQFAGSQFDPSRGAASACTGEVKATPDGCEMPDHRPSAAPQHEGGAQ